MTAEFGSLSIVEIEHELPILPRISAFTRPFWEQLAAGAFTTTRCTSCGRLSFPPKPFCRFCWSDEVAWTPVRPRGKLYSYTVVHVPPRAFVGLAPYALAIIDLDENLRIACKFHGRPKLQDVGRPAELVRLRYRNGTLFGAQFKAWRDNC